MCSHHDRTERLNDPDAQGNHSIPRMERHRVIARYAASIAEEVRAHS
jgi:hypothetical protein